MASVIRNVPWAVVWDDDLDCHVYRNDVDIHWDDNQITAIRATGEPGSPGGDISTGSVRVLNDMVARSEEHTS